MLSNYTTNSSLSKLSRFALILIIVFIFVSCGKDDKTESTGKKTEPKESSSNSETDSKKNIQSGNDFIIAYELSGKLNGKMTMNKNGDKIKQVMNMEIMGKKTTNISYILKDYVYSITEFAGNKFGIKTNIEDYRKNKKATGETITDFNDFEKFLGDKKVIGTENILGHDCDIYETAKNIKISVYNKRYVLKIESPEFTAVAVNFDSNPSFASDEFDVPRDVSFKSAGQSGFDKGALDSLAKKFVK